MPGMIIFRLLSVISLVVFIALTPKYLLSKPVPGENRFSTGSDVITRVGPDLLKAIRNNHYAYGKISSRISKKDIREEFLFSLDPRGVYFLQSDIELLEEVNNRSPDSAILDPVFFKETLRLFEERLIDSKSIINEIWKNRREYKRGGSIERYEPGEISYAKNREDLIERWETIFRYETMIHSYITGKPATFEQFQSELINNEKTGSDLMKDVELNRIQSILNHSEQLEQLVSGLYFNAIIREFDPHSMFFSEADKNRMEATLSDRAYSYGIIFERNFFGEVRIEQLIPGGPAWKSGKINEGDFIQKIILPSEKTGERKGENVFDVKALSGARLDELLSGAQYKKIDVLILKPGGVPQRVTLFRERLGVEANRVNGYILNGKLKIGYIYLPSFYMGDGSPLNPGCADDVAREILKLRRERIEGLILDLRNNGGGSLKEALDLSGIFVDQGPLHIGKTSSGDTIIIKDPNRGTIYRGPLIVMVNGGSASASEFFAQAMKDYNRAIVVGTPTYGKASAQTIVPVGEKGAGYLKVTTGLFFNLSGETHQTTGVIPHILIPDVSSAIKKEKDSPSALPSESVDRRVQYVQFESGIDSKIISKLGDLSEDRQDDSIDFEITQSLSEDLQDFLDEDEVDLDPGEFFQETSRTYELFEKIEALQQNNSNSPDYSVHISGFDRDLNKIDDFIREMNLKRKEKIQADIHIDESYKIMSDFIKLKKK